MPQCACQFNGDNTSKEHRDFHREWVAARSIDPAAVVPPSIHDLTDIYVQIAELQAHAHDPSVMPSLTPAAQAVIVRSKLVPRKGRK